MVITLSSLTYRTIDPDADADIAASQYFEACVATYGHGRKYEGRRRYLAWLRRQIEEFPDGHVLAFDDTGACVGHLELQVPYGLTAGYISLYYVAPAFRGRGYGTRMHEYVLRYFRSWEAERIALHVAPSNRRAVEFYRRLGYVFVGGDPKGERLWKMEKHLNAVGESARPSERS